MKTITLWNVIIISCFILVSCSSKELTVGFTEEKLTQSEIINTIGVNFSFATEVSPSGIVVMTTVANNNYRDVYLSKDLFLHFGNFKIIDKDGNEVIPSYPFTNELLINRIQLPRAKSLDRYLLVKPGFKAIIHQNIPIKNGFLLFINPEFLYLGRYIKTEPFNLYFIIPRKNTYYLHPNYKPYPFDNENAERLGINIIKRSFEGSPVRIE